MIVRVLRAAASLVALAALLAGVPALLLAWGDPGHLLRVDWPEALLRPDDGRVVLALLAVIGWAAWAVLAANTIAELIEAASHGRLLLPVPGRRWLRPVTGALIGAVLGPLFAAHTQQAPPAELPVPISSVPPAHIHLRSSPAATESPPEPGPSHVVREGDELWSIAEDRLGAGERWREIVALNGLDLDERLRAGVRLQLPADAAVASAGVGSNDDLPSPDQETVVVAQGDTLWEIAEEHLADPLRWPEIAEANPAQISDPDAIDIGWELVLPTADPAPEESGPPDSTPHTGDDPTPAPQSEAGQADPSWDPTPTPEPEEPAAQTPPPPATEATPHDGPEMGASADQGSIPAGSVLGPIGGLLAAGIFVGLGARRRAQLLHRAVGRRVVPVGQRLNRFWSSLAKNAEPLPSGSAAPSPTSVVVGWDTTGDVLLDLEQARWTSIEASESTAGAAIAAMLTGLMCAPWSETVEVVLVAPDEDWAGAFDDPRLRVVADCAEAVADTERLCAQRRVALGAAGLDDVRNDPDLSDAFTPVVVVCCQSLAEDDLGHLMGALDLGRVGVSLVVVAAPQGAGTTLQIDDAGLGHLDPGKPSFEPQLIQAPARRAIIELFTAANSDDTEPAPWWGPDDLPPNVTALPARAVDVKEPPMTDWPGEPLHPTVLLLGPVDLLGHQGTTPNRARGQCIEYCAWLLANPGATASQMVTELLVAEATRRSNMSRLRTWLGRDADDQPYLPDAYSGQITLSETVTSDWERFQMLLSGGVRYASSPVLRQALRLVRGAPLDGVAFQWPWSEPLRTDMVSMISDAAAVLADRHLERLEPEDALWAVRQGQLATGPDETLATRAIHAFALQGDRTALDSAVRDLTRRARSAGHDLSGDTARRVQHALHLSLSRAHEDSR
ncbi:MAG: LysM peptidoglycan-binding domain-containing protein [Arachnia sp.]